MITFRLAFLDEGTRRGSTFSMSSTRTSFFLSFPSLLSPLDGTIFRRHQSNLIWMDSLLSILLAKFDFHYFSKFENLKRFHAWDYLQFQQFNLFKKILVGFCELQNTWDICSMNIWEMFTRTSTIKNNASK